MCFTSTSNKNGNLIEALHVGISLSYYGLIYHKPKYNYYIEFERLTSFIVDKIIRFSCELGFHYFYLFNSITSMPNFFKKIIVEKLSKNFCDTKIVGVINSRQVKLTGSLSQFIKINEMYEIILKSAIVTEIEGNYKRAVIFYTFSGAFNNITKMFIKLLSCVISKLPTDPEKKDYTALVQEFFNTYVFHSTSHPRKKEQQLIEFQNFIDLQFLFKISQIWNIFHQEIRDYEKVLSMIHELGVFPCLEIFKQKPEISVKKNGIKNSKNLSNYRKIVKKGFISLYDLVLCILTEKVHNLMFKVKNENRHYLKYKLMVIKLYIKRLEVYFGKTRFMDPLILEKFQKIKKLFQ